MAAVPFLFLTCLRPLWPFASRSNVVRKSIAIVNTVVTQVTRGAVREFYKNKKYIPLDLRKKQVCACGGWFSVCATVVAGWRGRVCCPPVLATGVLT